MAPLTSCNSALTCYQYFLGIAQPTVTFHVSVFTLVTLIVVMISLGKTYSLLSKAMKSHVKKEWFYNFRVCLRKFDVVTAQGLPNDQELDRMLTEAKCLDLQKPCHLLSEAVRIISTVPRLAFDKENPNVESIVLRTLRCRPEPSIYSILSLFSFTYDYVSFVCENYPYRFGYYYDYLHQKPALVRLKKEESLFDYICAHLKKKAISAEQLSDKTVDLPNEESKITLKTVILALHIPFSHQGMRVRAAFQSVMAETVDFARLCSVRKAKQNSKVKEINDDSETKSLVKV